MIKRIERYQFEHINMIKNASIHLHKRKFLYICKNKSWKNCVKSYKWKNGRTEKTRKTREGKIKKR